MNIQKSGDNVCMEESQDVPRQSQHSSKIQSPTYHNYLVLHLVSVKCRPQTADCN